MESTYLPETAAEPETDSPPPPPVPALIFLESAEGADVCPVDGECV